jgi:hypothetical protein
MNPLAVIAITMAIATPVSVPTPVEQPCEIVAVNQAHKSWVKRLYRNPWLPNKAKAKHRRMMNCARPAQAKAMRKRWHEAKDHRTGVPIDNWRIWVAVGRCEQPGPGRWGVNWSFGPATYEGGLGFYASSWDAFKPKGAPSSAAYAGWRQQMRAADNLWASVGWGWGCGA